MLLLSLWKLQTNCRIRLLQYPLGVLGRTKTCRPTGHLRSHWHHSVGCKVRNDSLPEHIRHFSSAMSLKQSNSSGIRWWDLYGTDVGDTRASKVHSPQCSCMLQKSRIQECSKLCLPLSINSSPSLDPE